MDVYLIDGTYELFRHYYALPSHVNGDGLEVAATRGVVASLIGMLESGLTYLGVATDHVIESFRNELWAEYKDGSGIEPELRAQFEPLERALRALGVTVWAMEEYEADDALAAAASMAARDERVGRVYICTPDKDLAQCVVGDRVVQYDRRHDRISDADAVVEKFGVPPSAIPDYLALVGDSADGFPGVPGWGAKSAATLLAHYGSIEAIPVSASDWAVGVRGARRLAESLTSHREQAMLFLRLATLDLGTPVSESVDELAWRGPGPDFRTVCGWLDAPDLAERVEALAGS